MGRSPYQSEKRRKELARLKKQEEKRQRRFNKKNEGEGETPVDQVEGAPGAEDGAPGTVEGAPTSEEGAAPADPAQTKTQNDAQP
jgi:hypothetical protein